MIFSHDFSHETSIFSQNVPLSHGIAGKSWNAPTPFIIFALGKQTENDGRRKNVEIDSTPHEIRITTYYTAS